MFNAMDVMPLRKVPRSVLKITVVPMGTGLPELSRTSALMVDELKPSAGIVSGVAVKLICPTTTAPSSKNT